MSSLKNYEEELSTELLNIKNDLENINKGFTFENKKDWKILI